MLEGAHVAVVVPAYDEARLIARTLGSIPRFVDHVVVVDDASRDHTVAVVTEQRDPRVELVRHAVNRGVGAAIATGYRRAFGAGADVAAVMAGDAQMDPADLRRVVEPVVRGEADYVKGDRLSHPDARARMPMTRWVGNHALTGLTRIATGLDVNDSQCGYTALCREAARRLPLDRLYPRYGYPNDLLSLAAVARLRVGEVVVEPVYGDERSGIRPGDLLTRFSPVLARSLLRRLRSGAPALRGAPDGGRLEPREELARSRAHG
jgi:glycosyltransferase involved in cell wall biosynthesis